MEAIWSGIENAFAVVGLNNPVYRFVAMGAVGGIVEYSVRPAYSYRPDGSPRPWVLISGNNAVDSTYLPAGSTAIITGLTFALFV